MDPIFLELGPVTIHWYGVFMAAGFLAGLYTWQRLGRREGLGFNLCSDLLFWVILAGILGARITYVVAEWDYYARDPLAIVMLNRGGLVYYGGMVAAVAAVGIFARRRGLPPLRLYDLAATAVPLAHALGRVGCFLNGCCYGAPSAWAVAVRYPSRAGSDHECAVWRDQVEAHLLAPSATHSLPVHPVQLYEAACNVLFFVLLVWLYRRRRGNGSVAGAYLIGYGLIRFAMECFRGDRLHRVAGFGLSSAQWVSAGLFVGGLVLVAWVSQRGGGRETAR